MKSGSKLFLFACFLQIPMSAAWSQEDDGRGPLRCVSLSRIDRTDVIDNETIVFYLRGGDIYVNELNRTCPRLEQERRFSYRTSTSQLCSLDLISVIENSAFGIRSGTTCQLGMFVPTTEELLEILKGNEEAAEIEVKDIEIEE